MTRGTGQTRFMQFNQPGLELVENINVDKIITGVIGVCVCDFISISIVKLVIQYVSSKPYDISMVRFYLLINKGAGRYIIPW